MLNAHGMSVYAHCVGVDVFSDENAAIGESI